MEKSSVNLNISQQCDIFKKYLEMREKKLIQLISEIVINSTLKECNEKSNKVSQVQSDGPK